MSHLKRRVGEIHRKLLDGLLMSISREMSRAPDSSRLTCFNP